MKEQLRNNLAAAVYLAAIYYLLNPDKYEDHVERARKYYDKALHRLSVWHAINDIRSLPVTRVTRNRDHE